MKTIILAALSLLALSGCGRPGETVSPICAAPTASATPGQVSVVMVFGVTPLGKSIEQKASCCASAEILETDIALLEASHSACEITELPSGIQVNCFGITDGVTNSVSYTRIAAGVGCVWEPPYAQ